MKIKILEKTPGCMPKQFKVGDWFDLSTAEEVTLKDPHAETLHKHKVGEETVKFRDVVFHSTLIPLGVAMQLPKGFEAIVAPRSSSFRKFGIIQTNSIGVIDGKQKY